MNSQYDLTNSFQSLAQLSLNVLPRMLEPGADLFCFKRQHNGQDDINVGTSFRYSAIALIGVASYCGSDALTRDPYSRVLEGLRASFKRDPNALDTGELGLLLWLTGYLDLPEKDPIVRALGAAVQRGMSCDSMNLSLALSGLAQAECLHDPLIETLVPRILAAFNPSTGLFALNQAGPVPAIRNRFRVNLGSFASQVYPLVGLSLLARVNGMSDLVKIIRHSVGTTVRLQGDRGEWWWIFDTGNGSVVLDYPVYSVHQDSMGPMALMAAGRVEGVPCHFEAIQKGLDFLAEYREPGTGLPFMDLEQAFIWRAAVRPSKEDPADLPFGVSNEEFLWMRSFGRPKWLRTASQPKLDGSRLLREMRPYCPGWILYASSLAVALCKDAASKPESAC
jgi:hypothetical protein